MRIPKFLVGLLIGGLLSIVLWYWQKSTSAEDGALSVLDRLAESEARVRELEAQLRLAISGPAPSPPVEASATGKPAPQGENTLRADDLQQIEGIGPTYARRLREAGIISFADLAGQTPAEVMEISAVRSEEAAAAWISAAREQASG